MKLPPNAMKKYLVVDPVAVCNKKTSGHVHSILCIFVLEYLITKVLIVKVMHLVMLIIYDIKLLFFSQKYL